MTDEFESVLKAIKEKGFITREDVPSLQQPVTPDPNLIKIDDVLNHMQTCNADDCSLHNFKNNVEYQAMLKGIVYGHSLGKR